jgi:hypothetical protein
MFEYVEGDPVTFTDPEGLVPGDKTFGINDPGFWKWWGQNNGGYGSFDRLYRVWSGT